MSNSGILMLDISIIDTNNMDALTNRLNIGQEKMKWKSHFDNHLIAKEVFNMKYKFELWNYDFFAYEEAERHLNDMSERGWDIVGITLEWLPIGVYQRRLQNKKKRYSIVPVEEDDHDFYVACEDAGWHKVRTIRGGLCIFEAQGDFAKPLFSDEMTKYQNLIEVMETNNPVSSFILTLILLLFIFFQDFKTDWGSPGYYVLAGICLMGLVANVVGIKEYLFHKKAAEYAEEGIILEKSSFYLKFNIVSFGAAAITWIGLLLYLTHYYITIYPSILGTILTAATPFVFLFGSFIRAAKHFDVTGVLLMYISIVSPGFVFLLVDGV